MWLPNLPQPYTAEYSTAGRTYSAWSSQGFSFPRPTQKFTSALFFHIFKYGSRIW